MRAGGSGLRVAATVLGLLAALPAAAQSEGDRRLRQLEVFENLLGETIQRYVNAQVDAGIEEEMSAGGQEQEPVVVRVGASLGAHGTYIHGYGVLFTIQRPQISVLPRAFAMHLEEPLSLARWRMEPTPDGAQRVSAGMLRFQSTMVQRRLREMEEMLAAELAAETDDAQIATTRAQLEQLREQMAEIESRFRALGVQPATEAVPAVQGVEGDEAEPQDRADVIAEMVDRQRSMQAVLERNMARMRDAVDDAATDTLAHWGRVITGLQDDERLSVLVMPPTSWNLAQRHGVGVAPQEYVISVRYRDVRDFDEGKIDLEEFRRRARTHDRLGRELPGTSDQEP